MLIITGIRIIRQSIESLGRISYNTQGLLDGEIMNGVLLVNKPKGMTSHDVVNRLRRILNMKKIGHTGTLDPNAEGVLMVLLGNSTKILPFIKNHTKEYVASLTFGYESNTLDIWGNLTEYPVKYPGLEQVQQALQSFVGKQQQIPPMVSAIKVNGKKLYEYAREGKEIEREPRDIEIMEMELLNYDQTITFRCACSSGTYIRSLCVDLADRLGQKGILSSLTRTKIDSFALKDTYSLEDIEQGNFRLLSNYQVLNQYPYIEYHDINDIKNGKQIYLNCDEEIVMIVENQTIIAAYAKEKDGIYVSRRGLW
ncbi:MAG: tRNA pseudouridine(55) synthase TruB [Erysipelotrichaceae bacterium]|nr:tRNA pseudouridine(55) synthase TruB [Erysipelotrichaceae bacterium]